MPTFGDYAKLGISDFLARLGGGRVDPMAFMGQVAEREVGEEFLAVGGLTEYVEGPDVPHVPGITPQDEDSPIPLQYNVPTMFARQRSTIDAQKKLGQLYVERGMTAKGLGLIQQAEKQQADIQKAQAQAEKARFEAQQKKVNTVINVAKTLGPQGAQNIADQLNIDIDISNEKALVGEAFKINGMPYFALRSRNGFEVVEPIMSGAGVMLTNMQAGKFGPHMTEMAWKHHTGMINLNSEEGRRAATEAALKDWQLTKEPAEFEKKLKMEEHALKMQNYKSMISTRAARLAEYKKRGAAEGRRGEVGEGKMLTNELKRERLKKLQRENKKAENMIEQLPLTAKQKAELRILESQAKDLERQKTKAMTGKEDLAEAVMRGLGMPGAKMSKEDEIEIYNERLDDVYRKMDEVTNQAAPTSTPEAFEGRVDQAPSPSGREGDNPFRTK